MKQLPSDNTAIPEKVAKQWRDAMKEVRKPPPIPEGWVTTAQLSEVLGVGRTATLERLYGLIREGKAERRYTKAPAPDGRCVRISIYKLK